jgi:hypothetical protein
MPGDFHVSGSLNKNLPGKQFYDVEMKQAVTSWQEIFVLISSMQ